MDPRTDGCRLVTVGYVVDPSFAARACMDTCNMFFYGAIFSIRIELLQLILVLIDYINNNNNIIKQEFACCLHVTDTFVRPFFLFEMADRPRPTIEADPDGRDPKHRNRSRSRSCVAPASCVRQGAWSAVCMCDVMD